MNDPHLERELRATLRQREEDVRDLSATLVIGNVVRRARRHQIVVTLAAVGVAAAFVTASVAGASALLRSSERRVPVEPIETPSPSIAPAVACPPGSTPDEPGPLDQARPSPVGGPLAFDRDSGRIVLLSSLGEDGVVAPTTTWTFDVCTNTWQQMSPNQEPTVEDRGGRLVYDADSDLTIALFGRGPVWAYDVESDTWMKMGPAAIHPDTWVLGWVHMAYDPVSGLVVVREAVPLHSPPGVIDYSSDFRSWLWTYDVDTDGWVQIHDVLPEPDQPGSQWFTAAPDWLQFVYDASVGRFVALPQDSPAWTFDLTTATWSSMQAVPPSIQTGWGTGEEAAYDEAAEMTVVFSNGLVAGYDASADRWVILDERDGAPPALRHRFYHSMVYDPVNERLVVYGGSPANDAVWAFDVATREWTRLLAPSAGSA